MSTRTEAWRHFIAATGTYVETLAVLAESTDDPSVADLLERLAQEHAAQAIQVIRAWPGQSGDHSG